MAKGSEMITAMENEIEELKKKRMLLSGKMGELSQSNGWDKFEHEIDEVIFGLESDFEIIIKHLEKMEA
ncbi:hypothetical protein PITCH_A1150013 [uncultured Desulfobacterium sp.]|uniref:Uncharacterized protein n=1 Tax=uncultured Desulfobacterium sp. TaxID=201089 RepID=A0A445MR97_9BACT|nr:hypothetical protein PITCH_A1150013 [uncultured Desulfobacterium sp.]